MELDVLRSVAGSQPKKQLISCIWRDTKCFMQLASCNYSFTLRGTRGLKLVTSARASPESLAQRNMQWAGFKLHICDSAPLFVSGMWNVAAATLGV